VRRGILTGLALAAALPAAATAAAHAAAIPPYKTVLVSRQSDADGGAPGDDDSVAGFVRGRGRLVFFDSSATNFTPETAGTDPSYRGWTFLRDVVRGITTPETRRAGGRLARGGVLGVSRDARYLAMNAQRASDEFDSPIMGGYLRDRRTGAVTLVTRASGRHGAPARTSAQAVDVSNDGRYVLIHTSAPNLAYGDVKGGERLLLRDTHTHRTTRVTPARSDHAPYTVYVGGDMSGDGRYVTWAMEATRSDQSDSHKNVGRVVVRDVRSGRSWTAQTWHGEDRFIPFNSGAPRISDNGRYVTYAGKRREAPSILRWDRRTGSHVVVSRGGDFDGSAFPSISASGRFVAFAGTRLRREAEPEDRVDVWERDVDRGRTYLVSRASGAHGARGDSFSRDAAVSPDGHYVAFTSNAFNLTAGEHRTWRSVFLRHAIP
jgi:Tol biopolymer transport system component